MSQEVELIKERLNIADIVGETVALKRSGSYFKGLCPFHSEKTPSFIVSPDKGIWHCFGACGEGGDVFSFVQKAEGLDFLAALKLLAERAGVKLSERQGEGARRTEGKRERLFSLLDLTSRFYTEILLNQGAGAKVREYLRKRGVTPATMREFGVGYAPHAWDTLQAYLRKKGYSPQEMLAAGVVGTNQRGKLFDRFRGRIMFPITDLHGRVVAFGGRIAPWHETGEEGKYINSPETELYSKRRVVYNLARAKQHLKGGVCLVVEGYLDVILVAQAGVPGVVGSCGTAFTEEHITQLKRFTDALHFAFDADAAGMKAGIAATQAALAAGMRVATVTLPDGQDPADIVAAGAAELQKYVSEPQSLVSVLIARLKRAGDDAGARQNYLEALVPFLAATRNPVQLGEMIQEVAALLSIPESRVVRLLEETSAALTGAPESVDEEATLPQRSENEVERYALGLIIATPAVREYLMAELGEELFTEPAARLLYASLRKLAGDAAWPSLEADEILARLPDTVASYAEGVRVLSSELLAKSQIKAEDEAKALAAALKRRQLKSQLTDLQEKLLVGNDTERTDVLKQFHSLTQELSRLKTV